MKLFIVLFCLVLLTPGLCQENEDIFLGEENYPGLIKVGKRSDLFYWLFKSRDKNENAPLVMWLSGGPGCSSSLATFFENGPFNINEDLSLRKNPYSWNEKADLIFMDQPIGTGFSKARRFVMTEKQIAIDMYEFLLKFIEIHPEYKHRPFFITGESYAGHYIPAIGAYLTQQKNPLINLKGVAIGNGWVSPYQQYPQYSEFAYENQIIGDFRYYLTKIGFAVCSSLINWRLYPLAFYECQLNNMLIIGPGFYPFFNPYDIRQPCSNPPLCYDFSLMNKFLGREDVRAHLGVEDRKWTECDFLVHLFLLGDWMNDFSGALAFLLENEVQVLVYSGDKDFICNWRGGEEMVWNLPWNQIEGYREEEYKEWCVDRKCGGAIKSFQGLSFLRVFEAGHMVPMDQPHFALSMINEFIYQYSK
jgi:cathepsin A (carboxypeptidase C)